MDNLDNCIVKQISDKRRRKLYVQCLKYFFISITYIVLPFLCIATCYDCYIKPEPILIYNIIIQLFGCCVLLFTLKQINTMFNEEIESIEIDILELKHDLYKK